MTVTRSCPLPEGALLERYDPVRTAAAAGGYVDCFTQSVAKPVSLGEFVYAFYTAPVFRLERWILTLARLPSSDEQARGVADGELTHFAAWNVEDRTGDELLMCDVRGHTRSWFRVEPNAEQTSTKLFFGSAIVPIDRDRDGKPILGRAYRALMGFHRLYSRVLLNGAARRLS